MKTRIEIFLEFRASAAYKSIFNKLNGNDISFLSYFLTETERLDVNEFSDKVNNMWISAKDRPRNHIQMWAILSEINSHKRALK